jgi:hypothetical protein
MTGTDAVIDVVSCAHAPALRAMRAPNNTGRWGAATPWPNARGT